MSVFMSYCPQFWGSKAICMARKTRYMFESYDQKLIVFAFYGRFHELLPTVFRVSGRFAWLVRPDTCLRGMQKTRRFRVLWSFSSAIAHCFGFVGRFAWLVRPDTCLRVMTKNSVFAFYSHFHELLPTVLGVSGRFAWLERPDTCLRVRTKNS